MSILIYVIIVIILIAICIKRYEIKYASQFVHSKTGKIIPHSTIFEGIVRTFKRFVFGGNPFDAFKTAFRNSNGEEALGMNFMGRFMVATRNPNDLKNILSMKQFTKVNSGARFTPMMKRYLGDSLLFLNGEQWNYQRKAINSAMNYSKIKEFVSVFKNIADILIEKVKQKGGKEHVDMCEEFTLMTFDVIGKAGFGFEFNSLNEKKNSDKGDVENNNKELNNMKTILKAMTNPLALLFGSLLDKFPTKKNQMLRDTAEMLDKWINGIVVERKEMRRSHKGEVEKKNMDLLDRILEAEKEENVNFSSKELHNNIFLFFFAGHDTSSSALTSCLYFLAKYPEYIKKAREEVEREIGDEEISFESIQKLSICNAIIKEALRLLPPAPLVTARTPEEDVEISGYFVPKGTLTFCVTFMAHFDEKYWEKPDEFRPERFLEESSKEAQKNAYFPFGYGPRRCPGDKFAMTEICVTLVRFLQNFKGWELKEGWKYEHEFGVLTTKPKGGLPLKFY